jgi:NAD(P)-dependent dehydrogenase (short-subunit alcohol dehydrogenase family)
MEWFHSTERDKQGRPQDNHLRPHLAGKVVLITDIDPEIGAEVADRLLQAGASILVTGIRAAEVISKRFGERQDITFTGVDELTTDKITELYSRIQQDYGDLDIIITNNDVNPELDVDAMFQRHATGLCFTLHKLHPLLRDGSAIVVCVSFPPEQRQKSSLIVDAATAFMESLAQNWALALETRRIRVNAVNLYKVNPDRILVSEESDLSSHHSPSTVRRRPNSVNEVASAVVELAAEDCSVNGAEVTVVDGKAQVSPLSLSTNSNILGSPELVVDNIVFLASDVSRPLTGVELFPEGEIRKL